MPTTPDPLPDPLSLSRALLEEAALLAEVRLRHGPRAAPFWVDGAWRVGWVRFEPGCGALLPVLLDDAPGAASPAEALRAARLLPASALEDLPPSGFRWARTAWAGERLPAPPLPAAEEG